MFEGKVALFLTAFGGTLFFALFNEQGSYWYLVTGALVLLTGFIYLHRVAKNLP
jgi:hypothetical protein